jgi:hypothetical protein
VDERKRNLCGHGSSYAHSGRAGTLRRRPLNVSDVNKALKEAVRKVVIDPEAGSLSIHWHHANEAQEGLSFSVRPFAKNRLIRTAALERP